MITDNQRKCVECYKHYKDRNLGFMFNECSEYQDNLKNGTQDQGDICFWFEITLKDIRDGKNGKRLNDGITNAGILRGIAEAGLEEIPKEAYMGRGEAAD